MAAATDELSKYSPKKESFVSRIARHRHNADNRIVNHTSCHSSTSVMDVADAEIVVF